jgi:hypothetical protein
MTALWLGIENGKALVYNVTSKQILTFRVRTC